MMTQLRERTALILWFVIFAFIALMVVEWGADFSSGSRKGGGDAVGVVNGVKIPLQEFQGALRNASRQRQAGGQREDEGQLVNQVWQSFVQDVVMGQEMDRLGVQVSDEELAYYARTQPPPAVRQMEAFQTNGQFDQRKYSQFLTDAATRGDATNRAFLQQVESVLNDQLRNYRLQRLVMETVHVSPVSVREYYAEQNEKVAVEYVFATSAPGDVDAISDAELQAYYQEHQQEYFHPEQVRVEYVVFPKAASAADSVSVGEEIKRIKEELNSGADFAELAQSVSEDPGSASRGGDLGTFGRGRMVPAFEQVAFSLPPGQVSEPVSTRFGWHLIKVEEHQGEGAQEQVHARHILLRYKPSRDTEEALHERVEAFQAKAVAEGFQNAAGAAGVQVQDGGYLARGTQLPTLGTGTTWVVNTLFDAKAGEVSKVAGNDDALWVAHVVGKRGEGIASLADVRDQVEREVRNAKAAAAAAQRLQAVRERAQGGASMADAARSAGLEAQRTDAFSRSTSVPGIGRGNAFISAAFTLKDVGQVSDVVTVASRGAYVIRLLQRTPVDDSRFEAEREQTAAQLLQKRQEEALQTYFASLFDGAKIEDNRHLFYTF